VWLRLSDIAPFTEKLISGALGYGTHALSMDLTATCIPTRSSTNGMNERRLPTVSYLCSVRKR